MIDALRQDTTGLFDERRALVVELRAAGVSRGELADLAGVGVDTIKQLLTARGVTADA